MYDVIVIGAGPAGTTAAKTLAEQGYRVLLTKKCKMPRNKSCSGMLIAKTLRLIHQYFGDDCPASAFCTPAEQRGMILTTDQGKTYRFEQAGWNVWRSAFDDWLARKAMAAGVECREQTAAVSCEEQEGIVSVTLWNATRQVEQARYVIDCEGVVGSIKRKLLGIRPSYITTYQTFHDGSIELDPHYFYAYLQPELSEYDAWFNVKDEMLVLGVSAKDPRKIPAYYQRFIAYMNRNHGLHRTQFRKEETWLMPAVLPGCPMDWGVGNVFFAGETAGFLNPMGEGISSAIESGYAIGKAIGEHFEDRAAIYQAYEHAAEPLHRYMCRQWSLIGSMNHTFSTMK